jgi:hypothetical protein
VTDEETPLFERDALVVLEIIALFKHITNSKFECTPVFVPIECGEVIADEPVQFVTVAAVAPVAWR